jgi:hypothetical protein
MAPVSRSCVILASAALLGWMAPAATASSAKASAKGAKVANGAQEPAEAVSGRPRAAARQWSVTLQTGLAETFQLTLGGVFGAGPAWQSRVILTRTNVFRNGDSVSLTGFNTHDTPTHNNDWTAAVGYRTRLLSKRGHLLYAGGGMERWRFPGVLSGAQDWIAAYHATYATKLKRVPVTVQTNGWSVLHSPLTRGSLAYTTVWFDHKLHDNDRVKVVLRHGPQHTYSWNFYGTNGHRVVRYASALVITSGPNTVEAGYRPQYGLQKRIPHNHMWHFMLSRTF